MQQATDIKRFDHWFDETGPAAVVLLEQLQSVVEGESVIFPPTYAPEQSSSSKKSEYAIDTLKDGRKVCQVDSVGSQANRMEPIFKNEPYCSLVPQVTVEVATGHKVNLLDAGHRAADAIVRFSTKKKELAQAFGAWLGGDASKLAEIAPTSLVFGAWDSRDTQAKAPRIVSSIIRAYDVEMLTRSAQYIPALDYNREVLGADALLSDDQKSEFGLSHVPAPKALGGILVHGEIRKEATLNCVVLRSLAATTNGMIDTDRTLKLRRYILGLALVALTKPMAHNLRQGCLLVGVEDKPAEWKLVYSNGKRETFQLLHQDALEYAKNAAGKFGVTAEIEAQFDPKLLKAAVDDKAGQKEAKKASKKIVKDSQTSKEG